MFNKVKNGLKKCLKMQNNAECRLALLVCQMALCHATRLRLWWADFSYFFDTCFAVSSVLKDFFFVCDHETLSYLATNSLKLI